MIDSIYQKIIEQLTEITNLDYVGTVTDAYFLTAEKVAPETDTAVFINLLEQLPSQQDPGEGVIELVCRWELFCASNVGADLLAKQTATQQLANSVMLQLDNWTPTLAHSGPMQWQSLSRIDVEPEALQHAVWKLDYNQTIQLVRQDGSVPTEITDVFLGLSPDIGAAHIDDYKEIV